jgi:DNA processing protein
MIDKNDHRTVFFLALDRVPFLRAREKALLVDVCGSAERVFALAISEIGSIVGRRFKNPNQWGKDAYIRRAESDMKFVRTGRIGIVPYADERYPAQLAEVFDPPFVLYFRGTWPAFETPAVAIVGTRHPTGEARSAAYGFAFECAEAGLSIVSGLARGIDQEAHAGTVAVKGRAIAVLGNGIDAVYPRTSTVLARRIIECGGVIVSENPPGTPPLKYRFPERNRIVSGLSRGTVVVQAPSRSGALITADFALEQGRDLFVHRAGLDGSAGTGSARLATEGARVVEHAVDLLDEWEIDDPRRSNDKRSCDERSFVAAGVRLASMLEHELDDDAMIHNGETYGREPVR